MLKIHDVAIEVVRGVAGVVGEVERRDRDLGRQLRRAVASVPLNIAEGSGVRGGNRRLRYETALGSAREVRSQLQTAEAFGYLKAIDPLLADRLDHVIAVLVKLVR